MYLQKSPIDDKIDFEW